MAHIYVLWSNQLEKRYIGSAANVALRLQEHNSGKSRFTKGGIPWVLIHVEELPDLPSARRRESYLKSGVGRSWLDKLYPQYTRKKT